MKAIINGKKYDTATAQLCGSWTNSMRGDFSYCAEDLYKKRTGEFFLYGEGGPMSKYSRSSGQNSWSGDEQIVPLTFVQARQWAEEHLDADEYEKIFGEVAEDGSIKCVMYSLPVAAADKVKRIAAERKIAESQLIAELIDGLQ